MKICICGGGNLGHVVAGVIAANGVDEVRVMTRRPRLWGETITVDTPAGNAVSGRLACVSASPGDTVAGADVVMLCLPGWSIAPTLDEIRPALGHGTAVGSVVSSTGFYFEACRLLPAGTPVFGFQRVPFIARTTEYGHRASLLGYKKQLYMGVAGMPDAERLRREMERMLSTPVALAGNMYEVSLPTATHCCILRACIASGKTGNRALCTDVCLCFTRNGTTARQAFT